MTLLSRLCLAASTTFVLALGAVAAHGGPATATRAPALAPGPAQNNVCPPPKHCAEWADPGHHICIRCV
jgi:hypothetical protein